jgi:SAM-dependent methyltransferase
MNYNRFSEKSTPSGMSIKLIEEAISQIKPDYENINDWYSNYANNQKKRLAFDVDYICENVSEDLKIIEFGSTPPILTLAIQNLNYDIQGVDLAPERFKTAISSSSLDIKKVNIETDELPFDRNTFDVAVFNEIFEHLRINPIFTISEIFKILKPGGVLFLSTPNLTSLVGCLKLIIQNKAKGEIYTEYMKLINLGHMGHVREYTPVEIGLFLHKIGFDIKEIIYRGEFISKSYWKWLMVNTTYKIFPRFRPYFSVVATKPFD